MQSGLARYERMTEIPGLPPCPNLCFTLSVSAGNPIVLIHCRHFGGKIAAIAEHSFPVVLIHIRHRKERRM